MLHPGAVDADPREAGEGARSPGPALKSHPRRHFEKEPRVLAASLSASAAAIFFFLVLRRIFISVSRITFPR